MYYVYELVDPRDGVPFYIGKGKGARIDHHEKEAKREGVYSRKVNKIREIWAAGLQVQKAIIQRFKDEHEAYAAEKALIEDIGLANLTNVVPGGVFVPKIKVRKASEWTLSSLMKLGPSLARALREYGKHGNLFACGFDITKEFVGLVNKLRADLGETVLKDELRKHGVHLTFAEA